MANSQSQLGNDYAKFFEGKIIKIHNLLTLQQGSAFVADLEPIPSCSLLAFKLIAPEGLYKTMKSAPIKLCSLDPIPAQIFEKVFTALVPIFTIIVNKSLQTEIMPSQLKEAIVIPTLKKPHLDTQDN